MTCLRFHIFLAGLDTKFNQAQSEILQKDPPLDLESCYAYMRKDHNQRHTMEEPKTLPDSTVLLAMRNRSRHAQQSKGKNSSNKTNNYTCTHCGDIQNNVAMKSLGTLNGGISQRNLRRKLDKPLLLPQKLIMHFLQLQLHSSCCHWRQVWYVKPMSCYE